MAKYGFGQQFNASCDGLWYPYGLEYCLEFVFLHYSWNDARSYCANNSAYLVDELDSNKSTFFDGICEWIFSKHTFFAVFTDQDGGVDFWLGLNDKKNDGIYVWDRPDGVEPQPVSCKETYTFHSLEF